ncbi:MAG: FGGY family carbohydrate kinase, partial [Ilumatobacteraceae bacterium]
MDRSTGGYVLSADLGTTGLKVAVVDDDGVVRGHAGESLPMIFVGDGGVEQDPELWWQALARCARRALAAAAVDGSAIARLAVTSQYSTTVAVDAAGMPLANATMWMDRRSSRHHSAGGRPGQVAHLRVANPAAYARSAALVEPVDALCARLTGRVTATQNTMFPLGVIDNTVWDNTAYSPELVGQVGIDPQRLPQLLAFGEPRGTVTVTAAEFLGVRHGTPVMSGTVDSVTSAIGTGALDPHSCGLIIGTTSVIVTHVGSAREDAAHGLATAPSPMPHSWFVVAENGIGGKALDVFVRNIVFPDDGLGRQLP